MDFIFGLMAACAVFIFGWWLGVLIAVLLQTEEFLSRNKEWLKAYFLAPITIIWRGPIWLFKNARSIPAKLRIVFSKD